MLRALISVRVTSLRLELRVRCAVSASSLGQTYRLASIV
eukprot:COSAG06_NODE_44633_length_361_cov_12.339695_1_plen_38_part_10